MSIILIVPFSKGNQEQTFLFKRGLLLYLSGYTFQFFFKSLYAGFNRPKRLLVFINPIGGRKLGRKIYTEQVQPLFELANIKVDLIGEYIAKCRMCNSFALK